MGYEDEVVINFAISQVEDVQGPDKRLDPKMMTISLTGNLFYNRNRIHGRKNYGIHERTMESSSVSSRRIFRHTIRIN